MINIPRYYDDMLEWCTHDADGFVNGIRPDAPEEMKKKWEEFQEGQAEARRMNEKRD